MKIQTLVFAALLAMFGPSALDAQDNASKEKSFILVDVEAVADPELKFLGTTGYLTIARYDESSHDIVERAHQWRSGKISALAERAIALRSPVQKRRSTRQFLIEVEPGRWVIESANGTVFSQGSWAFDVPKGAVLDLGVFQPAIGWQPGDKNGLFSGVTTRDTPAPATGGLLTGGGIPENPLVERKGRPIHLNWHKRSDSDTPPPTSVLKEQIVEASFSSVKFTNYLPYTLNPKGFTNCIDKVKPDDCGS